MSDVAGSQWSRLSVRSDREPAIHSANLPKERVYYETDKGLGTLVKYPNHTLSIVILLQSAVFLIGSLWANNPRVSDILLIIFIVMFSTAVCYTPATLVIRTVTGDRQVLRSSDETFLNSVGRSIEETIDTQPRSED